MFTQYCLEKNAVVLSLLILVAGGVSCSSSAEAMGRSRSTESGSVVDPSQRVIDVGVVKSHEEGYELGLRNGRIMSDRLRLRTVDTEGCVAIDQLQQGLLAVTHTVRPPLHSEGATVRGFYHGYLDAVREAVLESRKLCGITQFGNGGFAGTLFGGVVCQVQSIDAQLVSGLEVASLYRGWSGGSVEVQEGCRNTLLTTVQTCSSESISQSLSDSITQSCLDRLSL